MPILKKNTISPFPLFFTLVFFILIKSYTANNSKLFLALVCNLKGTEKFSVTGFFFRKFIWNSVPTFGFQNQSKVGRGKINSLSDKLSTFLSFP